MTAQWKAKITALPIASHLDTIASGIEKSPLSVIEAPPGTGKTTVLPLALLNQSWLADKSILVLQPRRLASRSVATRMAELLQEPVGETIGYSVRLESKRSKRTRVEVITEGLLTRRLIADPELKGVGVVMFDEFHERSIHADISLALTLETQSVLRPDLRIVVMSATLGESLPARILDGSWRYSFGETPFPVTISYSPGEPRTPVWERVASAIKTSASHPGDILAFLPGAFEIQRTQELLERSKIDAIITPLFGDLPYSEQARAIQPDPTGRKKVVLATTIAETSLTIEGVRTVIDSGLHKVSRFDPSGFSSLNTEPITRDAADQRAGRAGRTAPGRCVRLWSEQEHLSRRPFREPEVLRVELAPHLLDLAAWGVPLFTSFSWVTPPPESALQSATLALQSIDALNAQGSITERGRTLARLGANPILGSIALTARAWGLEEIAATLIALLEERDIFAGKGSTANILDRVEAVRKPRGEGSPTRRIAELRSRWLDRINGLPSTDAQRPPRLGGDDGAAVLLALAFPSRIARRRDGSDLRYLLASGRGGTLTVGDPLASSEFLATCVLQEGSGDLAIRLAAPLNPDLFKSILAPLVKSDSSCEIDPSNGALLTLNQNRVGAIVLSSRVEQSPTVEARTKAFVSWLSLDGFSKVPFGEKTQALIARVSWARGQGHPSSLPDLSSSILQQTIQEWLIPQLSSPPGLRDLSEHVVYQALEASLTWQQRRELDEIAPAALTLPSGRSRPLSYEPGKAPSFEARIQDLFGVPETPRIGRWRVPAAVTLLSPAHRPVQVTQDLASFWRSGYAEVRKELKGRYPKHKWPEDPLKGSS